jgi:hypothetical protein
MFTTDNPADFLERAEMHEQLAAATDDIPARKMHLAMASEYRRKAKELSDQGGIVVQGQTNRILKLDAVMH